MQVVLGKASGKKRRFTGERAVVSSGVNCGGWVSVVCSGAGNSAELKWRSNNWTQAEAEEYVQEEEEGHVPEVYFSQRVLVFVGHTPGSLVKLLQLSKRDQKRIRDAVNQAVRVCEPPRGMRAEGMARSFLPWVTQCRNLERLIVPYSNSHYKCMSDADGLAILKSCPKLRAIDFRASSSAAFVDTLECFLQSESAKSIVNLRLDCESEAGATIKLLSSLTRGSLTELDVKYDKYCHDRAVQSVQWNCNSSLEHLTLQCTLAIDLVAPQLKTLTLSPQKGIDLRSIQCESLQKFQMKNCQHHGYSMQMQPLWVNLAQCSLLCEIQIVDTLMRSGQYGDEITDGITDDSIQLFNQLSELRVLIIVGQAMTAPAFCMPALTELTLEAMFMGSKLQNITLACPKLQKLSFNRSLSPVAGAGLISSAPHCPSIKTLHADRCRFTSVASVLQAFQTHSIEAVSMHYTEDGPGHVCDRWQETAKSLWPDAELAGRRTLHAM
jgi:hypothetical protein